PMLRPLVARGFVWLTVGLYEPPVRELLGYRWSPRDVVLHRLLGKFVNAAFSVVPRRWRMHPRTRDGWDRATGRLPASTPLVHSPIRYLPPVHERENPMHYCPVHASRRR
ncbi:MAG: oxygenase MpaB family protein, partial [Mycobacteriaceae bacterium]